MLPYSQGPPCSLVRVPDTEWAPSNSFSVTRRPHVGPSHFRESQRLTKAPYVQIDRVEALIAAAQVATRIPSLEIARPATRKVAAGDWSSRLDAARDVHSSVCGCLRNRDRLKRPPRVFCKTTGARACIVRDPFTGGKNAVRGRRQEFRAHHLRANGQR